MMLSAYGTTPGFLCVEGHHVTEDAALAVRYGVDAVWVSNHGGRQLDHGEGTLDVRPGKH